MEANHSPLTLDSGTATCTVVGEKMATAMSSFLIEKSAWFMVTPLPDDKYLFTVKQEAERWLPR